MSLKLTLCYAFILPIAGCASVAANVKGNDADISEELKESLVYLNISAYTYNQVQPWKNADIVHKAGYGCAVGPYEILTTAWNASDAAFIKVRRYGQNEFIPARVKVIDYESNLCLLCLETEATDKPLTPLNFIDIYQKGAELQSYWLSAAGHLTTGRGYLDKAKVYRSMASYARFLNYVATNTSNTSAGATLYCIGKEPIGIACWADADSQDVGLVPATTINRFLADAREGDYAGFGAVGFEVMTLLDPAMRTWLKMPGDLKDGAYVSKVYNLGTGSDILRQNDVILAIEGQSINAYGRFLHEQFDRVSYHYLITSRSAGETITFDIWRDGKKQKLQCKVLNFEASEMLVPYYEYGMQPEYVITAGFVFQKLTRDYLQVWGDNWSGKSPPNLYRYYHESSFEPTDRRSDIVILSYVLPADINLGYHGLGQMVVSKFNGKEICSLRDILEAQKLNPESKYDVVEFEDDYPTVVIPRAQLSFADIAITQTYGIGQLVHVEP